MSGQDGRGTPDDQTPAHAQAGPDATATAIAGLRWRLMRQGTLNSPEIMRELRKLEEQVTAQLEEERRKPGRHRSQVIRASTRQIADASGFDLKPDPLAASTITEYIRALWLYKAWSGDPSWRKMAAQAGQVVVHSTMYAAMNGDTLPKLEVVRAIISGCGGSEEDLRAFATAWRRLNASGTAAGPDFLAAPVTPLSLVPGG